MKKIKIYGERNAGTNYLEKLIQINFSVGIMPGTVPFFLDQFFRKMPFDECLRDQYFKLNYRKNLGWKHREVDLGVLNFLDEETKVLALVKNPYSWLLSMHKRPYHFEGDVSAEFNVFVRTPWKTLGRESSVHEYKNAIDMWNRKTEAYLNLVAAGKCKIIRYEDILISPLEELNKIKKDLQLPSKSNFPKKYLKSAKAGDSHLGGNHYLDYYGKEKWKEKLDAKSIEFINENLNKDLLEMLGYKAL